MPEIEKFNKIVIANWKLNGNSSFVTNYIEKITPDRSKLKDNAIILCPPFTYLKEINSKYFFKGAQDCSAYLEGAYTGELSVKMLKDVGCEFCIVGHSERRIFFNESDEMIQKKIINCIDNDIVPILCVGENLIQKKEKLTKDFLKNQIYKNLPKNINLNKLIIAYEPVWSIGTGIMPELNEISEIHIYIKNEILHDTKVKLLYGGSVKANNYKKIINLDGVNGLLVGGASINLDEFNKIIEF